MPKKSKSIVKNQNKNVNKNIDKNQDPHIEIVPEPTNISTLSKTKVKAKLITKNNKCDYDDKYTQDILTKRYSKFKENFVDLSELVKLTKLPIRQQNPPEDITENIVKFIIINYDNDISCKWAKSIGKKGDLYSDKYKNDYPIEVKALTSSGPSSFGPKKKFGVIYFLDMRGWLSNILLLWKVNVSNESIEWKQLKMNKLQTHESQCKEGRRPHISWDKIRTQMPSKCVKIYEGTFENIFMASSKATTDSQ